MIDFEKKIRKETENGGVALIPFTILGFPNLSISMQAINIFCNSGVAAFETAIPVGQGWSQETNQTIKKACITALNQGISPQKVINFYQKFRPNIFIVYKGAFDIPFKQALVKISGKVDSILPEWGVKNPEKMSIQCQKNKITFVDAVSPLMDWDEIKKRVTCTQSFIYLSCAPETGGRIFPINTIKTTILKIKKIKPNILICCGFGIQKPDDVKKIGAIEGCDGIIIGTAFLDSLNKGITYFNKYFKEILKASKRAKR